MGEQEIMIIPSGKQSILIHCIYVCNYKSFVFQFFFFHMSNQFSNDSSYVLVFFNMLLVIINCLAIAFSTFFLFLFDADRCSNVSSSARRVFISLRFNASFSFFNVSTSSKPKKFQVNEKFVNLKKKIIYEFIM